MTAVVSQIFGTDEENVTCRPMRCSALSTCLREVNPAIRAQKRQLKVGDWQPVICDMHSHDGGRWLENRRRIPQPRIYHVSIANREDWDVKQKPPKRWRRGLQRRKLANGWRKVEKAASERAGGRSAGIWNTGRGTPPPAPGRDNLPSTTRALGRRHGDATAIKERFAVF